MTSTFILQFFGLFMLIVGVAALFKTRYLVKLTKELEHHNYFVYLLSIFRVMIGLALVLTHNMWGGLDQGLASLIGRLVLAVGVFGLFDPEDIMKALPAFSKHPSRLRAWVMVTAVCGAALTMFGFGAV